MIPPRGNEKLNDGRKGDIAEYYAITWLWDQGYEVFMNAGSQGPIDMVAFDPVNNVTKLIDVKNARTDARGGCSRIRTKLQKELGVVFISFDRETRKLKWVQHRN